MDHQSSTLSAYVCGEAHLIDAIVAGYVDYDIDESDEPAIAEAYEAPNAVSVEIEDFAFDSLPESVTKITVNGMNYERRSIWVPVA